MIITEERRQQLIAECKREIKYTEKWLRANKKVGNPESTAISQLEIHQIALEALEGNSSVMPNGWKLVPGEPTEAMIEAGDVHMDGVSNLGLAWDAMLEASPLPPAGGGRG